MFNNLSVFYCKIPRNSEILVYHLAFIMILAIKSSEKTCNSRVLLPQRLYNLCSAVKEGYSCNIPSCMYNVHVPNCRSERTCLRFIIYKNRHNHRTINWIKQLGVTLVAMYYTVRRENKVTYCIVYKIHHKNDDSNKFEILLQQMIFVCWIHALNYVFAHLKTIRTLLCTYLDQ